MEPGRVAAAAEEGVDRRIETEGAETWTVDDTSEVDTEGGREPLSMRVEVESGVWEWMPTACSASVSFFRTV
jgi:hypothetical protein